MWHQSVTTTSRWLIIRSQILGMQIIKITRTNRPIFDVSKKFFLCSASTRNVRKCKESYCVYSGGDQAVPIRQASFRAPLWRGRGWVPPGADCCTLPAERGERSADRRGRWLSPAGARPARAELRSRACTCSSGLPKGWVHSVFAHPDDGTSWLFKW